MILNELFTLSELSPDTLASYKKKAGADASAADAAGDYARGNKRFKGIVKATKKQFANDTKGVAESYPKHQDLSGISTDKLEAYLAKQSQQQVPGEGNQVKRVRAELQSREQGLAEVSKATLDRYVKKAVDAHGHADFAARQSKDDPALRSYHKGQAQTAEKRRQGISRALDRMSKTEGVAEGAAKFDPKTGLPVGQQLSEFGGDATEFMPPTQSTPTTEQPPRRGYSIMLTGKPGRDWMAEYAWQALEAVFPREYPGDSSVSNYSGDKTVTPAMQKVLEVANRGSAVVKTGITSEDIAETLVAKLAANRVPAQYWRITSEDLDEGVTEGINDRGFFNNVEQWHEAKSDIEHDDQWETPKYIVVKNNGKTVAKWSKADNYGWVDSSEQGVAEGSGGNWYIRVNGKILNDTKFKPVIFSSEDEARSHAMKLADKKRIPLSQIKLTKSWMDAPDQGVAEGFDGEYDDEAGMADNNLETLARAVEGIDDLIQSGDNLPEWCQEKIAVAKSMLVAVWDYMESEQESEDNELQSMMKSAGIVRNI